MSSPNPLSNLSNKQSNARVRQVNFWKKHQTILQHCADLSDTCNVKILVSHFPMDGLHMLLYRCFLYLFFPLFPQCIMSISDKKRGNQHQDSFEWTAEHHGASGGSTNCGIDARFSDSNTIIFDSFSSEEDVRQRNLAVNNISKINDPGRRFAADFSVRVTGKVTTILSASTVSDYRVVDERRSVQNPMHALVAKPIASFSSVISAAPTTAAAIVEGRILSLTTTSSPTNPAVESPSFTYSSESTSPPTIPVLSSLTDNELIESLAAASAKPTQVMVNREMVASLTALSTVATQKSNDIQFSQQLSTTPPSSTKTDQLRQRCHGLLQQRGGGSTNHQRQNMVIALNNIGKNRSNTESDPMSTKQSADSSHSYTRDPMFVTFSSSASLPTPDTGSFFVSVPRPTEVHQTLLQTSQVGRKRDRNFDGDQLCRYGVQPNPSFSVDTDGYALNSSGSGVAASGIVPDSSSTFFRQDINASPPPSISAQSLGSMADAFSGNAVNVTGAPATPTKRSPLSSLHEELTPSPTGMRIFPVNAPSSAAMSSAFTPLAGFYRRLLPPMTTSASDAYDVDYHPFQQQQRLSSTDIHLASMAFCPMPDAAERLNFSDIKFRRSSEEIIALCALSELSAKK